MVSDRSQLRLGTADWRCAGSKTSAFATIDRAQLLGSALTVSLSKIVHYLTDNICLFILSRVEAWGQRKAVGLLIRFQFDSDVIDLSRAILTSQELSLKYRS